MEAAISGLGGRAFYRLTRPYLNGVKPGQVDSWVWKPSVLMGFLVRLTYDILLDMDGGTEDRSERVLWGLFRFWKS